VTLTRAPDTKNLCEIEVGEFCRVPKRQSAYLLGYRIRCPRCEIHLLVMNGQDGQEISVDGDELTARDPVTCRSCGTAYTITKGIMEPV